MTSVYDHNVTRRWLTGVVVNSLVIWRMQNREPMVLIPQNYLKNICHLELLTLNDALFVEILTDLIGK